MKRVYKKKPKQKQIDNLLSIYAAIGAAAKEAPAHKLSTAKTEKYKDKKV